MNKCISLSIETSLNRIYLVIIKNNENYSLLKEKIVSVEIDLNVLIDKLMKKARIKFADLDIIFVSLGPGSFTGTRVGIAAAKAISVTTGKKIIGYSNFDTIYYSVIKEDHKYLDQELAILIKANKLSYYTQRIKNKKYTSKAKVINFQELTEETKSVDVRVGSFNNIHGIKFFLERWPSLNGHLEMIKNSEVLIKEKRQLSLTPIYIKEHYAS